MPAYRIVPIESELCDHVRTTRTDPIFGYDYDVAASVAGPDGYGPCRQCLQTFNEGERRLLFLHNPFGTELGDFAAPVFIHEAPCSAFGGDTDLPAPLRALPLFLRSYSDDGHFVQHSDLNGGPIAPALCELFANPAVAEVHVRNAKAKCFVAKAVRAGSSPGTRT